MTSIQEEEEQLRCTSFGLCEPCPEDALNQEFCLPYGNRRLMHCSLLNTPPTSHSSTEHPEGEVLAWSACGRIPSVERRDFLEFILCNLFFAFIALGLVYMRERKIRISRARVLAARIGLVGRTAV